MNLSSVEDDDGGGRGVGGGGMGQVVSVGRGLVSLGGVV